MFTFQKSQRISDKFHVVSFFQCEKIADLSHRNERITNEGLVEFNNNIVQNLQSLQKYTLAGYQYIFYSVWYKGNFRVDSMRSKGVEAISKDVWKNLKNLKELELIFFESDESLSCYIEN